MTYESVANVEWLDKPTETFEYEGYHFEGVGKLRDNSYLKVSKLIRHEKLFDDPGFWNYNDFSFAATTEGIGTLNIFRCVENDTLYLLGANELFRYA